MTTYIIIVGISAALSLALSFLFLGVSRATGWRHYRLIALLALVVAIYSLNSIPMTGGLFSDSVLRTLGSINFGLAITSPALWILFDAKQEQRQLAHPEKALLALLLVGALLSLVPGVTMGEVYRSHTSWLDITSVVPAITPLAMAFVVLMLLAFASLALRYAARVCLAPSENLLQLGACILFVGAVLEEGLVAMQMVSLPFIVPPACALAILMLALDLSARVGRNANKLAALNEELEQGIAARTAEIMHARNVLMSTERHAAIGTLAAGVSHEVNNPLAYVHGTLEFLRDNVGERPEQVEEAAAIADALGGVERIRQVVLSLASYARSTPVGGAASAAGAIDLAMRVVRPQTKFSMIMELDLEELPPLAIDQSKLVQVLVNLLLNAAAASEQVEPMPTTSIRGWLEDERVTIEVRDHGRGVNEKPGREIFAPQQSAKDSVQQSGPDLFLSRGILEAADATIDVVKSGSDGTTIRIRLPISLESSRPFSDAMATRADPPGIAGTSR